MRIEVPRHIYISKHFNMNSVRIMSGDKARYYLKQLFSGEGGCCGCSGCGISSAEFKEVDVDGSIILVKGLDDLFRRYYDRGMMPDDLKGDELLDALGSVDHLSEDMRETYKDTLLREYKQYCKGKLLGKEKRMRL